MRYLAGEIRMSGCPFYGDIKDLGNSGTTFTMDWSTGNVFRVVMTGNVATFTQSNFKDGQRVLLYLTQDGTGTRTMTWPAAFKWAGGTAGVLSTPAGSVDLLEVTYNGTTTNYYAELKKAFA